jgi:hypothetical protein
MRAMPDRKPGSMDMGNGLQADMPYLVNISLKYFDWSSEMVRANPSRVMCMPNS